MSKKSLFRKTEKSSSEAGTGSSRDTWAGDSWFRFAMYWDTLGPRWPLYPDMSDDCAYRRPICDGVGVDCGVVEWSGARRREFGVAETGVLRMSGSRDGAMAESSDSMGEADSVVICIGEVYVLCQLLYLSK